MRHTLTLIGALCATLLSTTVFSGCTDDARVIPDPRTDCPPGEERNLLFLRTNAAGGQDLYSAEIHRVRTRMLASGAAAAVAESHNDVVSRQALYRLSAVGGDGNWYAVQVNSSDAPRRLTDAGAAIVSGHWLLGDMLVTHNTMAGVSNLSATPINRDFNDEVDLTGYSAGVIDHASIRASGDTLAWTITEAGVRHVDTARVGLAPVRRRLTRQGVLDAELVAVAGNVAVMRESDGVGGVTAYSAASLSNAAEAPWLLVQPAGGATLTMLEIAGSNLLLQESSAGMERFLSVNVNDGSMAVLATIAGATAVNVIDVYASDTLVYSVARPDDVATTTIGEADAQLWSVWVDGRDVPLNMTSNANHSALDQANPQLEMTIHGIVDDFVIYTRTSEPGKVWQAQIAAPGSERELAPGIGMDYAWFGSSDFRVLVTTDTVNGPITRRDLWSVELAAPENVVVRMSETGIDNNVEALSHIGTDRTNIVFTRGNRICRAIPGVANSEVLLHNAGSAVTAMNLSHNYLLYTVAGDNNLFSTSVLNGGQRQLTALGAGFTIASLDLVTDMRVVMTVTDGTESRLLATPRDPGAAPNPLEVSETNGVTNAFLLGY